MVYEFGRTFAPHFRPLRQPAALRIGYQAENDKADCMLRRACRLFPLV
jgi:hypothetical protein